MRLLTPLVATGALAPGAAAPLHEGWQRVSKAGRQALDSMHFHTLGISKLSSSDMLIKTKDQFADGLKDRRALVTMEPGVCHLQTVLRTIAR